VKASVLYQQAHDGYMQTKAELEARPLTTDDDNDDAIETRREQLREINELIDDAEEMRRYAVMRSKY